MRKYNIISFHNQGVLVMSLEDKIEEVENLLARIRESQLPRIDGRVLAAAVDLIYRCGLQQNEIPKVTVNDLIRNDNNELTGLNVAGSREGSILPIPQEVRPTLNEYLEYLRSKYETTPQPPLFPGYTNVKKISRSLGKFNLALDIHKLRRIGIDRHYNRLRAQGHSESDSLQATGEQFRISPDSVRDSITNNIRPAGQRPLSDRDNDTKQLLELVEKMIQSSSIDETETNRGEISRFLEGSSFSAEEKASFNEIFDRDLSDRIKQLKEIASEPKKEIPSMPLAELYKRGFVGGEESRKLEDEMIKRSNEAVQKHYFGDEEDPEEE
jgi:hypothetical protein